MFAIHFYGGSSWQGPWHAKLSNEPELTKTETRQTKLKSTNQPHLNLHMPCPSSSTNPRFNDNYTIHVPNLHKPASSVVQIHETHPSKRSQKLPPTGPGAARPRRRCTASAPGPRAPHLLRRPTVRGDFRKAARPV